VLGVSHLYEGEGHSIELNNSCDSYIILRDNAKRLTFNIHNSIYYFQASRQNIRLPAALDRCKSQCIIVIITMTRLSGAYNFMTIKRVPRAKSVGNIIILYYIINNCAIRRIVPYITCVCCYRLYNIVSMMQDRQNWLCFDHNITML